MDGKFNRISLYQKHRHQDPSLLQIFNKEIQALTVLHKVYTTVTLHLCILLETLLSEWILWKQVKASLLAFSSERAKLVRKTTVFPNITQRMTDLRIFYRLP